MTADSTLRGPGRPQGEARGAGREALLEAARELIADQGMSGLTSKRVAERAGLKPTLVNYYFGNRQGLVEALVEQVSSELDRRIQAADDPSVDPSERLSNLIAALVEAFRAEPYAPRLFFENVVFGDGSALDRFAADAGGQQIRLIEAVLESGRAEARFRDVDPVLAVAAIGGLCAFLPLAEPLLRRLLDFTAFDAADTASIARQLSEIALHGLLVGPERPA